jgi:hypothetical protein
MSKRGWLALCGVVAGTIGAYGLARAYRRARATCPPFRRRVYAHPRAVVAAFGRLWRQPERLASLYANDQLTPSFLAKLALAVAGAHGAPAGSGPLARYAQNQGLSPEQIASLVRGEMAYATVEEAAALYFARRWAEEEGQVEAELFQRLEETYGPRTARDVLTALELITFVHRVGNTADALVSRLLGQPSPQSTLAEELAVLAVALLGIAPLFPILLLRAARPAGCPLLRHGH